MRAPTVRMSSVAFSFHAKSTTSPMCISVEPGAKRGMICLV